MVSAGDFRNGVTFEDGGQVYTIVEFLHVKPGKGAAFVRTKLKNVITGGVVERTFRPTEKFPAARIERKAMQFLYSDDDSYWFMDNESYEQMPLRSEELGDSLKYLKENMDVTVLSFKGNVFGVDVPNFIEYKVVETDPGFKGDTAQGATKPATVENGTVFNVPLFINVGDSIRVDTRTGEYMERV